MKAFELFQLPTGYYYSRRWAHNLRFCASMEGGCVGGIRITEMHKSIFICSEAVYWRFKEELKY